MLEECVLISILLDGSTCNWFPHLRDAGRLLEDRAVLWRKCNGDS